MLTVKTIQKIERETTLVVPCFFKEKSSYPTYMGVLDEKTIVKVYNGSSFTAITSSDSSSPGASVDIAEAYDKWEKITGEEFFSEYNRAIENLESTVIVK